MGYDTLEIGPVPADEDCEQLGPNYNASKARAECNRFIDLIRKVVGPEPTGARLIVKSNLHDFGTYLEVNVKYDDQNPEAVEYALKVESSAPTAWDAYPNNEISKPVKTPITLGRVMQAVEEDENIGFCRSCGGEQLAEPDAERQKCENCGQNSVYGAEMMLLEMQA